MKTIYFFLSLFFMCGLSHAQTLVKKDIETQTLKIGSAKFTGVSNDTSIGVQRADKFMSEADIKKLVFGRQTTGGSTPTDTSNLLNKTSAQTISALKTYTVSPVVPVTSLGDSTTKVMSTAAALRELEARKKVVATGNDLRVDTVGVIGSGGFEQLNITLPRAIQTYTFGNEIKATDSTGWINVNPVCGIAELNIVLPATPRQGQRIDINFGGTIFSSDSIIINTLFIVGNVVGSKTFSGLTVEDQLAFRYNAGNGRWYRVNDITPRTTTTPPGVQDALFWLDGTIIKAGANYYLKDQSGNGRNFLITNFDFDSTLSKGFPYKSLATISAPSDAQLIASDVNSFLYEAGTPNQIPVNNFFQDIDYEHKLYSRHKAVAVDSNAVEVYEPRILDIVLYKTARTGVDSTVYQSYFSVPAEQFNAVWLSPTGDDGTGAGTKASPWRSLDKIKATTAATVYLKSGDYTPAALINFTGSTLLNLIGVGRSAFNLHTTSFGITFTRFMALKGLTITNAASTYGVNMSNDLSFEFCKMVNSYSGKFITSQVINKTLTMSNCIAASTGTGDGVVYAFVAFDTVLINNSYFVNTATNPYYIGLAAGVYLQKNTRMKGVFIANGLGEIVGGKVNGTLTGTLSAIKYSKWYGLADMTATANFIVKGNVFGNAINTISLSVKAANNANVTGVSITDNFIYGNRNSSYIVYVGSSAGEPGFNSLNGLSFLRNTVRNVSLLSGNCHTVFVGAGVDNLIKHNVVDMTNGYAFVVKAAGRHYTTTDAHISYNLIRCSGIGAQYAIYDRGAWGVICSNNTILNYTAGAAIRCDDDASSYDNTMLTINNVITLGANISSSAIDYSTGGMTSRNNTIIKNGYTVAIATGVNDTEAVNKLDGNGIPYSRINAGESVIGSNNIGLSYNYLLSDYFTFKTQDGTWQRGAIIK